ncbi:MAG: hypothetical protein P4L33_03145 [Capsulimonadaceae bacterium]|nr:hypothetical protein [Capsulimonadaceae bacterium]
MDEFTNGVLPATTKSNWNEGRCQETVCEATCPYCGWVYDQPEWCIPAHARCAHLIATAQWSERPGLAEIATLRDDRGVWRAWAHGECEGGRKSLEAALRNILVKVVSSTARTGSTGGETVYNCRYYFARRAAAAVEDLRRTAHGAVGQVLIPGLSQVSCCRPNCRSVHA